MFVVLRWWFIFCLTAFGFGVAAVSGFFYYLAVSDLSYLSWVVISLFTTSTLWIGQMTFHARNGNQNFSKHLPACWFISEGLMGIGMMGTLIGFLILLGQALGTPINTSDTAAMTALIAEMGRGFSTAALTTIVGLACSMNFKLQLINLEYLLEKQPCKEEK